MLDCTGSRVARLVTNVIKTNLKSLSDAVDVSSLIYKE